MAHGRNTTVFGVRVLDSVHAKIKARAESHKPAPVSVSEYCRIVLEREVMRSHTKKS